MSKLGANNTHGLAVFSTARSPIDSQVVGFLSVPSVRWVAGTTSRPGGEA